MVTLVAFDLKGAFNGVSTTTLDDRLPKRGTPTQARKWIRKFIHNRRVSVSFSGFESKEEAMGHAGLLQGSSLSPILFAFFNAGLVDQTVDTRGGASAYIDEFFR